MPLPIVQRGQTQEAQAIQKVHQEIFRVVPFDYIDFQRSTIPPQPVWADLAKAFDGDYTRDSCAISQLNPMTLWFVKPIYLNWSYLQEVFGTGNMQMEVIYVDNIVEILVHNNLSIFDVWAPPIRTVPVAAVRFSRTVGGSSTVTEVIMLMGDTPVSISGGVTVTLGGSANQFFTDDTITPIPAGPLGVAAVFGFLSNSIMFKNNSLGTIEISEDAGVTWEPIEPGWAVAFDWKARAELVIRDPLGVGGLSYRVWAW